MSALSSDPRDVGILAEPQPLSLYAQLDVANHQALAAHARQKAAAHEMAASMLSGHGLNVARALYQSATRTRIAALERINQLRGAICRAEREAGRIHLPRVAAPELRTP